MFNLGGVLFRSGDRAAAIKWCKKAARLGNADAAAMLCQLNVSGVEFPSVG